MTNPRIAPANPPYAPAVATALERIMPEGVEPLALFRTLAVNERVFGRVMAGGLLDRGSISLRDREIVIQRTCFRCGSEYEWGVHAVFFAGRAGLGEAELAGTCALDPETSGLPARDRLLLRLVDELHDAADVGESLWEALRREWSDEQRIELVVLAGFYHLISFATNALRVPLEPWAARFPSQNATYRDHG